MWMALRTWALKIVLIQHFIRVQMSFLEGFYLILKPNNKRNFDVLRLGPYFA